jgi:signal transduction histidine kinase
VVRVQSALKLRRLGVELRGHFEVLKQQRDDLLRLQLQKERLMAFVIHDLKNPVNSMDLSAQYLLRQKDLSPRARDAATRIRQDAQQLNRMILNLLDVSKAEEGRLAPRRAAVDLRRLVEEVLAENSASALDRKVTLQSTLETDQIQADEDLLRRLLSNLVENAIRHAPADSPVSVTARRLPSGAELRVADAGKGIPKELQARVFDAFVQVDSAGQPGNRQGRGLGLTFCKLVVEAHGGSIGVEDANPGAVFFVRLPDAP